MIEILGIDLGNYNINTSTGLCIESKIGPKSILTTSPVIEYADKQFCIGEGSFDTEYRKVKKGNYLSLLYSAIGLSTNSNFIKVVVGLPISQFTNDKAELINLILQNSDMKGSIKGISRNIKITDVEVYPEGVGVVPGNFEGVIVDIGGRTTDICLITKNGTKRKIENPFSEPIGMINLYSDFIKILNSKYGLDLKMNDSERILRNGLKINGYVTDISEAMKVFKDYVDKIVAKLKVEYPISTVDVAFVGGGAIVLKKPLLSRISQGFLVENSLFANANTFKRVGEQLWHK